MQKAILYFMQLCIVVTSILFMADTNIAMAKKHVEKDVQPFELPLNGATGYASVDLDVHVSPERNSTIFMTIMPGQAFKILGQKGAWLHITYAEQEGYVQSLYSMINLPDVIPSIVYKHTNASASILVASGKNIPNITGEKLYDAQSYNNRFQEQSYAMPILFTTALKIQAAQKMALADNNTLVIYETYRPYEVQRKISDNLAAFMKKDAEVRKGLTSPPWGIRWFISQGTSNHQRGFALDVSLARVDEMENLNMGAYVYTRPKRYTEYTMPTAMHELSVQAVVFTYPVNSRSSMDWKSATPAPSMTKEALLLQTYFAKNGLTPLASEWWHFNDLATGVAVKERQSDGNYYLNALVSSPAKAKEEPSMFDKFWQYIEENFLWFLASPICEKSNQQWPSVA